MTNQKWWQKAVFYQIYPRSFYDSNGDGIGDLKGIISKLDYLQQLGVDAIWLSPHYPSPMFDCGYDITDYKAVAPEYGSMDDFVNFLENAHHRGLRVITDLVLNHTSHLHPWFLESRSSLLNPKRTWYVWRDGIDQKPPNNWNSAFGDSAWEYDPNTGQYYYHFFFKEQPDLNWHNPEVKEAMFDVARFWLDSGVDGFRLDAIETIFEHPDMPDHSARTSEAQLYETGRNIKNEADLEHFEETVLEMYKYQLNQPGIHTLMQELRSLVDEYDDRILVGETDRISFYGEGTNELDLVFNFPLVKAKNLNPDLIRANQISRLAALPPLAWPGNTLGNHDSSRVFSHFGDGENDQALAHLSLALMLTLRGTPFLYYGEEIGMTDFFLHDLIQLKDQLSIWAYQLEVEHFHTDPEKALKNASLYGRDKCRTPLQWNREPNAGFSPKGVETWLPVNPNYLQGINVFDQEIDPHSSLNFYKDLLQLRKRSPALMAGDFQPLHLESSDYFAFLRADKLEDKNCLVILNFSSKEQILRFEELGESLQVLFSNFDREGVPSFPSYLYIFPFEIFISEIFTSSSLQPTKLSSE